MTAPTTPRLQLILAALALALLLAACGSEEPAADAEPTTASEEPTSGEPTPQDSLQIRAVDYAFEGVPDEVEAGVALSLVNTSDAELHELIAIPMPDDDDRTPADIAELPLEELEPLFAGVEDVIVAAPSETDMPGAVAGDGVLDIPGRYILLCQIPTGADPQALMEAAQAEDPEAMAAFDGAPHYQQGMIAELTVS